VLAYVLVSRFDDHLPLYRLNEIFARMGADIPDTTLVDWCGRAMLALQPLTERIETHIMGGNLLHADDTPIRVLDRSQRDKGLGKGVKKGRIWTYVRDPRFDMWPPAVRGPCRTGGQRATRGSLSVRPGLEGRTRQNPSREVLWHSSGRWLQRIRKALRASARWNLQVPRGRLLGAPAS